MRKDLTGQVLKELRRLGADRVIGQNLTTGIFYYCFECLNACPVGKRR